MPRLSLQTDILCRARVALLVALLLALGLHAVLLWWVLPSWLDAEAAPHHATVMQVRQIPAAALPHVGATAPASPQVLEAAPSGQRNEQLASPPPPVVTATRVPASAPTLPMPVPPTERERLQAAATTAAERRAQAPESMVDHAEQTDPTADAQAVPVYATKLPAAGQWRYQLHRGAVSAEATLSWAPQADGRYEARLEGRMAGTTLLDWVSRGSVDAAGIAPERFALRRRGRDQHAANFQRDAGKITFSGPTYELPLLPGAQDRLSWLLQLPAIVEANPSRFAAGSSIALMVVSARGGGEVWTFEVQGQVQVDGRAALKLVREARRAHDTQAEIWLDPARGHLPLRAVLTQVEGSVPLVLDLIPE